MKLAMTASEGHESGMKDLQKKARMLRALETEPTTSTHGSKLKGMFLCIDIYVPYSEF